QLTWCAGGERNPADGDRTGTGTAARAAGLVDVLDRRQERGSGLHGDPRGDATTGDPRAVANEEEAVVAGDVVEVERTDDVVGRTGDRAHQRSRVPVRSCVIPPLKNRWEASPNPDRRSIATISSGSGR